MRGFWTPLLRAGERFSRIDGTQWAGALAYSAFTALFPTILLFITAASFWIDPDRAARAAIGFIQNYAPMSRPVQALVVATISRMIGSRGKAGAAALLVLLWAAGQFFGTLVDAVNRAWGASMEDWWRLPLRSLALLGLMSAAAPAGMAASALARLAASRLPAWANGLESRLLPAALEFLGLALFYRFAPRRPPRLGDVWAPALAAALLLRAAETVFVLYLKYVAASNAVYGVFGGIMALLLWIYLAGCVFIYGACLCAALGGATPSGGFAGPPH